MRVVVLASGWGSKRDELSTFNRELSVQLAKHPDVQVSVFLPRCDQDEKNEAERHNISLVQATQRPGFDDEIQWLCCPPKDLQFDFLIGQGIELGRQAHVIQEIRHCKWIQFVHTDPEERGMLKDYLGAISEGEKKRRAEVALCVCADFVVAVGPKVAEAYRSYLRSYRKDQNIFVFTPGIFSDSSNIAQGKQDNSKRRVLVFGHGSAEDFSLKGYDIAARAVAKLSDVHLIFVDAKQPNEVADRLKEYGIPPSRLRVRTFTEIREHLKEQFSEVDLAIMPSRTEGFGLSALEAMCAGVPVLVSANSGFGEAMREVAFGSQYVVDSEDAEVWATEIEKVWAKRKEVRLQELKAACDSYATKYNWEEQCRDLVEKMGCILNGASEEGASSSKKESQSISGTNLKLETSEDGASSHMKESRSISGTIPELDLLIRLVIGPSQDLNDEEQEKVNEMLAYFGQVYMGYHGISTAELERFSSFIEYLLSTYEVTLKGVNKGSLEVVLHCPTLESLESLWSDHLSGYLNEVAERYLVNDEMQRKFKLETIKLKTTIEQENYLMVKQALIKMSGEFW